VRKDMLFAHLALPAKNALFRRFRHGSSKLICYYSLWLIHLRRNDYAVAERIIAGIVESGAGDAKGWEPGLMALISETYWLDQIIVWYAKFTS
jgi:hypothetical protein